MVSEYFPILVAGVVTAVSILLFITSNWRLSIVLLALLYLGVFFLTSINWPLSMAAVKLVSGWMSGAIIGMAILSVPELQNKPSDPADNLIINRPFHIMTTLIVLFVVVSQANRFILWVPGLAIEQAWSGLLLIGMGLLKLGFTTEPLHAILGLLTALAGFEVLYAVIEPSTLVAGLLASITLGLALSGAYLLVAPTMEEPD